MRWKSGERVNRWTGREKRGNEESDGRKRHTYPIVVLDLVPDAVHHVPVAPRLEAASTLRSELGLVAEAVRVRGSGPGGELVLLFLRQIQERLRKRVEVLELVRREAVPFEEEEALGSDTGKRNQGQVEEGK